MRASGLAFLSLGFAGGALAVWAGGCGQSFTAADGGAPDGKSPKDVVAEDAVEGALPEGASDSGEPPDAFAEAGSCRGLKGSFMTDSKNCGGCGHDCGVAKCRGGFCPVATIASGLMMPDSIAADGVDDVFFSVLGACATSTCTGGQVLRHSLKTPGATPITGGLTSDTFGIPVATDGSNVYWATSQSPGSVAVAPVAGGSSPTLITPASAGVPITASWVALAVDDKYLYAGASGATIYYIATAPPPSSLGSWKPIDDPGQVLAGLAAVDVMTVHYAIWINGSDSTHAPGTGSIGGVTVNTTGAPTPLPGLPGLTAPLGVSASAFGAFWVDGNTVQGLGLKSKIPYTLASPAGGLEPWRVVAGDKGAVYWTNHGSNPSEGSVMVLYHGANTPIVLASGQTNPTALAISASYVYWVNSGLGTNDGAVMSTPR